MRKQVKTQSGNGSSVPILLDYFGGSDISLQVDVISGSPNWTVEQTLQDPNSDDSPVVWYPHSDTNMVAQTVGRQSNYAFVPVASRVTINSGGGVVRYTVLQAGAPGDR